MFTGIWCGFLRDRDNLEDRHLEECIILKWNIRKWNGFVYFIEVVQGRRRRRKFVDAVMSSNDFIIPF